MYYNKKPDFGLVLFMIAFLFITAIGIITYKKPDQVQAYYETSSNYITNTNDKIKIFTNKNYKYLEDELNEFIQNNTIIDIEYGACADNQNNFYSALVHYKERK